MGEKGFRGRDGRLHEKGEKDSKAEEKFMRCQPSACSPSHTLSSKSTKTHNLNCLSSSLILRVRMREVFEAPMFSLPSSSLGIRGKWKHWAGFATREILVYAPFIVLFPK